MKRTLLLAAAVIILSTTPAIATQGLYLGVYIPYDDISGDVRDLDSGKGLGGRAGIGLNRYLAIEGTLFKSEHDRNLSGTTHDFKGGTLDLKLSFPLTGSNIEPFLIVGAGSYKLEYPADPIPTTSSLNSILKGDGTLWGFGIDMYMFPELSFGVGYTRTSITFDSGTIINKDVDVKTLDVGLTYHFL